MKRSSAPYALVALMMVAPLSMPVQAQSTESLPVLQTLIGDTERVRSAAFSPDGLRIVTTSGSLASSG